MVGRKCISLIDYMIWGLVLVLGITLFFYSFSLYRKFKNQAKENFKNRFSEKKFIENSGRLKLQASRSIRLFNSLYILNKTDLDRLREDSKRLP